MGDYAYVHGTKKEIVGIWFRDPANVTPDMIAVGLEWGLSTGAGGSPAMNWEQAAAVIEAALSNYRIVPNNFDDRGGCFVMFGTTPAPGEKTVSRPEEKVRQQHEGEQTQRTFLGRSPLLVGIVNFFFPGFGYFFLRDFGRGLIVLFLFPALVTILAIALPRDVLYSWLWIPYILNVLLCWDAYTAAKTGRYVFFNRKHRKEKSKT